MAEQLGPYSTTTCWPLPWQSASRDTEYRCLNDNGLAAEMDLRIAYLSKSVFYGQKREKNN